MLESPKAHIGTLQVLRGIAALLVFLAHWLPMTLGVQFSWGPAGVDLFFVISGFVMVYTSNGRFGDVQSVWPFVRSRLLRIVPLYWAVTTFAYIFTGNLRNDLSISTVILSYIFIPTYDPVRGYLPILMVGWTLNLEMFFYALFAIFLILPRNWAVAALSAVLIGFVFMMPYHHVLAFWSQPIVIEFVFGMWIALLRIKAVRLPNWMCLILATVGSAIIPLSWSDHFSEVQRLATWGSGAALIVSACVLSNYQKPLPTWLNPLASIGDASYALYLVHVPVLAIGIWLGIAPTLIFAIVMAAAYAANLTDTKVRHFLVEYIDRRRLLEPNKKDNFVRGLSRNEENQNTQ